MRRGQASILLLGLGVPLAAIAVAALAVLGAQVQGIRAQRLAEGAALRAALGQPPERASRAAIALERRGGAVEARVALPRTVLRLPFIGSVGYTAHGQAAARGTRTDDGRVGAVLVG